MRTSEVHGSTADVHSGEPGLPEAQPSKSGGTYDRDWHTYEVTIYPEHVLDHFQDVINSSLIHNPLIPQISRKAAHKFSSYSGHKQTIVGEGKKNLT